MISGAQALERTHHLRVTVSSRPNGVVPHMAALVIVIIVLLLLGVLGAVIEGLLWLTLIAAILVVGGIVFGWFKFKSSS